MVWSIRWGLLALALLAGALAQKTPVTDKEVVPILREKCWQCHGETLQMGNSIYAPVKQR